MNKKLQETQGFIGRRFVTAAIDFLNQIPVQDFSETRQVHYQADRDLPWLASQKLPKQNERPSSVPDVKTVASCVAAREQSIANSASAAFVFASWPTTG